MSDQEEVEAIELRKEQEVETDNPEALRKAREWDDWKDGQYTQAVCLLKIWCSICIWENLARLQIIWEFW